MVSLQGLKYEYFDNDTAAFKAYLLSKVAEAEPGRLGLAAFVAAFTDAGKLTGGTTEADNVFGTSGNDVILAGLGNDVLSGGSGSDTYVYARGDGNDTISEGNWNGTNDQLVFSDINPADVRLVRNGADLTIVIPESAPGAGDAGSILVKDTLNDIYERGIEKIVFADGTTWTRAQIRVLLLEQAATAGNDTIAGFNVADVIAGGAGDDALNGASGDDTYVYARGDGNDTITEDNWNGTNDRLVFSDINPADVRLVRNGADLTIVIPESAPGAGDAGSILIKDTLNDIYERGIEKVVFADGTTWTRAQIRVLLLEQAATAGNDTIAGFNVPDVIAGGAGDDALNGASGDDTYVYTRGDGNDTITEDNWNGTNDRLVFSDINPADVTISFSGTDLLITIVESAPGAGDVGSILIKSTLGTPYEQGVERIVFADGTTWDSAQIRAQAIASARTVGNDIITGFGTGDTYAGGKGNDIIDGGAGNDTYVYARGDGNDTITEGNWSGTNDQLVFSNINPADVRLVRNGTDLTIVIAESAPGAGDAGSILIKDTLDGTYERGVEKIVFADGTIWTRATYVGLLLDQSGTSGNDTINGTSNADLIAGGLGDDALNGKGGNDTYVYARGDGNDTITEDNWNGTNDQLVFSDINPADVRLVRNGADLTIVIPESAPGAGDAGSILVKDTLNDIYERGIEKIVFADGTTWTRAQIRVLLLEQAATAGNDTIAGFNVADVISGGAGDDALNGASGDDTYVYARGDGNDTITEDNWNGTNDQLVFSDINPADVRLTRNGADLTIVIPESAPGAGDAGSILIKDTLNDIYERGIEKVVFADGTTWTRAQIRVLLLEQAATAGNDTIAGFNVGDTISGGAGDDALNGASGDDTYVYARGDGNDTITEDNWNGTNDQLVFSDINPADVRLTRNGADLTIVIPESAPGAGDAGSILVKDTLNDIYERGIEKIVFADGTTWTRAQIRVLLLEQAATAGNDTIAGFNVADVISGGAGDDALNGASGDDTYVYARGDGNDTITEDNWNGTNDRLVFSNINPADVTLVRNGTDLTILIAESAPGAGDADSILVKDTLDSPYERGIEKIVFANGTTWSRADMIANVAYIAGSDGNDTITGTAGSDSQIRAGLGNDALNGLAGSDTYVYRLGDGNDVITEVTSGTDVDTLAFADLNLADIRFERPSGNTSDVVIRVLQNGETITLKNQFNQAGGIERITFADGTVLGGNDWSLDTYLQGKVVIYGTSGNDILAGTNGNDVFIGGLGDDRFNSGAGSDTYIYASGDGSDYIDDESGSTTDIDIVKLTDLNVGDVTFSRSGTHVKITVNSTGHVITLDEQLYSATANWGVEQIEFANGTTWNRDQIKDAAWIRGTSGNDTLSGTSGNDTFAGGLGDDRFNSGAGSDTYIYASGDGSDYIDDESGSTTDVDVVRFTDLNVGDLTFSRSGVHATIKVNSTGHVITLDEQFYSATANWGIEQIQFADGTVWDRAQIQAAAWIRGTTGNDTLGGTGANDTLFGDAGNDTITTGAGNDIIVFKPNFGIDTITDFQAGAGSVDVLEFDNSLFADFEDVLAAAAQVGNDTVITHDAGNTITLKNVALANLHQDDVRFIA
ncbi:calcium-binding protein [Rhizobium sp. ZPR3]|uniref:Calcium-binding protein n=2 Tax=unclassified Rhizobium TaxID=2613769 RepID=A0AAU7SRY8_9HYPH